MVSKKKNNVVIIDLNDFDGLGHVLDLIADAFCVESGDLASDLVSEAIAEEMGSDFFLPDAGEGAPIAQTVSKALDNAALITFEDVYKAAIVRH